MNIPIDVSGGVPIEVSGEKLASLNKRLFPTDSNVEGSSPQRFVPLLQPVKSEIQSNSVSTLEDNFGSPSGNNRTFISTPSNSRSQPFRTDDKNDSLDMPPIESTEDNGLGSKRTKSGQYESEPPVKSPKLEDPNESGSRGAASLKKERTIDTFFTPKPVNGAQTDQNNSFFQASTVTQTQISTVTVDLTNSASKPPTAKPTTSSAVGSSGGRSSVGAAPSAVNAEFRKDLEAAKAEKAQAENKLQRIEVELRGYQERSRMTEERNLRLTKALEEVHRKMALTDMRNRREKLALDSIRLGKFVIHRVSPTSMQEAFLEGNGGKELNQRRLDLDLRRAALEERKKQTMKAARGSKSNSSKVVSSDNLAGDGFVEPVGKGVKRGGSAADKDDSARDEFSFDYEIDKEVTKAHIEQFKRDELSYFEERRLYETDKAVHQRELKRCSFEENSQFYRCGLPTLNQRYLLQSLLGKGGFSEVWKALDLLEMREVAVKIHQLNVGWTEERKQSYIKHVTREYTIHRDMKHPRIIQLFDVFEIDVNSFATVLEFSQGIDLDEKLKRCRTIPEKDAKIIMMQILSGLRYLNRPLSYVSSSSSADNAESGGASGPYANNFNKFNQSRKLSIIHYDLKPANILFDEMGDVKITDFGLSKIIDESDEGTSMELTSQGAGTYWYLPPECFAKGHEQARISSKVDVWSAGIIFYQMLYGSRPYGEGKTQENVWSNDLIRNASPVEFPVMDPKESSKAAPKVSEEAKEFIRACLTRDQRARPDILEICESEYFVGKGSKKKDAV